MRLDELTLPLLVGALALGAALGCGPDGPKEAPSGGGVIEEFDELEAQIAESVASLGPDLERPAERAGEHAGEHAGEAPPHAFFGEPDQPRLDVLRDGEIVRIERGGGGRSVGLRLTFADGSRAYFKPEQRFSGASDAAEVASYLVDRMLGLGRSPVTSMRVLPASRIRPLLANHPHRDEVIVRDDGTVRGSLSAWIEQPLVPLVLGAGFERFFRVEPPPFITPFQRASVYIAQASGREPVTPPRDGAGAPLPPATEPDVPTRPAELSDLVLYDHLINNIDRWGGGFTNVRTLGPGGPLVFLDQGAAFGPGRQGAGFMRARLESVQRFRRSTVEAIERFDVERLRVALDEEATRVGEDRILDEAQLEALEARRRQLLEHVHATCAALGEEACFPF